MTDEPDCTGALVSWKLDGGEQSDSEQFAHIFDGADPATPDDKPKPRLCPWCEQWEPYHTNRCWIMQRKRPRDPWGEPNGHGDLL